VGEARRRKRARTDPQQTEPLSRADAIAWAVSFLATTEDATERVNDFETAAVSI
jgi:hypothetical protein